MKKIILNSIAALVGLTMAASSFAAAVGGFSKQSIQEALEARNAALHQTAMSRAATVGTDTYIVIINYSDTTIAAIVPTAQITLTRLTAGRYQQENFMGQTEIQLYTVDAFGNLQTRFWDQYVDYQDLISVYLSNGQYVVYDTK